MAKRPNLKRAEYDKGIAWIACNATPASIVTLVAYHADLFGQRHADVSSDVSAAMRVADVQRGSRVSALILSALYTGQSMRSDPARGV